MTLRRGFKKEAHDISREIRCELKLALTDPLDPWLLANYLEIPISTLSFMKDDAPFAAYHFSKVDTTAFSAVTVFYGYNRKIIHNDSHHSARQASNIAHELSHALLHHLPTPALDDRGDRNWNQTVEDEASWLGGALLVSEEAALMIARDRLSFSEAAQRYHVSEEMIRFRLNVTGAQKRTRMYWSANKV